VTAEGERYGDGTAEITEAWWEDEGGERQTTLHQGRPFAFKARVRFNEAQQNPTIAVVFENEQHQPLVATSTDSSTPRTGDFAAGDELLFSVSMDMAFAPGRVYASPWVTDGKRLLDRRPQMTTALVVGPHQTGGLVDLPHDVRLETNSGEPAGAVGS
jgi:hypothetical protein